ncbi:hypothetical protein [Pseudonocardia sp. TRM90224]|uniref:hypothetical protein n=1 Tax=Pseudonocardia sp. TRM90224 TaxID=2812678 RepID=UPI001E2C5F4B|nr:hypothetical protein [Pseudonocardia sp. TRM90224]
MTTRTGQTTNDIPVVAALIAGVGAQVVDDAAYIVFPPTVMLAWLSGLLAIALTAGAARIITRSRTCATVARTGLAVGVVSAGVGLLIGGFGLIAIILAGVTVVAGVAGAVAGRKELTS